MWLRAGFGRAQDGQCCQRCWRDVPWRGAEGWGHPRTSCWASPNGNFGFVLAPLGAGDGQVCRDVCQEGRDPPAVTRSSTSRCQALERRADSSSSAATLLPCPSTFLSPVLLTSTWGPHIWAGFSWTWFLLERQLQNVRGTRRIFLCCGDLWARSRSFLFVGRSREMCQL